MNNLHKKEIKLDFRNCGKKLCLKNILQSEKSKI